MAKAEREWIRRMRTSGGRAWRGGSLALALLLAGCSGGGGGGGNSSDVNLANVPWCTQPSISFQDDSTSAQKMLTDWSAVKDQLGFTPYLPTSLPKGSCLALAGGSIHDPIFGGKLSITYVVPQAGPLAFSEAPKRATGPTDLQCVTAPVPGTKSDKTTICQGVIESTSITVVSRQTTSDVQKIFQALQPNVPWVPSSSLGSSTPSVMPSATPSVTPSATSSATPSATAGS